MTNLVLWTLTCFAWTPNPEPDIQGYRLYWGPSSGHYTNSVFVSVTNALFNPTAPKCCVSVPRGVTNFFTLTAVGFDGQESLPARELYAWTDPPAIWLIVEQGNEIRDGLWIWQEAVSLVWEVPLTNASGMIYRGRMEFR